MSETTAEERALEVTSLQIQIDPSLAAGRYATMVMASLGENETLLTFVAQDLMAPVGEGSAAVAHAVARVFVANQKLRSVGELLIRQADAVDARESDGASA